MKTLFNKISSFVVCLLIIQTSYSQNMEVTHQANGTTLSVPVESIDSVKFQLVPSPILKKIYQNNGNILGVAVDDIDSITYQIPNSSDLADVTTNQPTVLSSSAAFGGGNVSAEGSTSVTQRGVCWSTTLNPTLANSYTTDGSGLGNFTSSIFPLIPSTTYYVRAYAVNSAGTAYGNTYTITTQVPSSAGTTPIVATSTITYMDGLTASCGGNITADGGLAVIARGVCWAVGVTPTINNSFTVDGAGAGTFNSAISNLLPNTSYFVRAYATNDAGTAYGITYSFTTNALPVISTGIIDDITTGSVNISGSITSDGGSSINSRGFCWAIGSQPTINDNVFIEGSGIGNFNSILQGLLKGTTYYFRAFATNGVGTSYGVPITATLLNFNVIQGNGVTFDGYSYQTAVYGNGQEWMVENLRTTVYSNGDVIPNVQDGNSWIVQTAGAWAHLFNSSQYENSLGKLYNWYAAADSRNVCPINWHLPSISEWMILIDYLGGSSVAGSKMKSVGTDYWQAPNSYATNESEFSVFGSGVRADILNGAFNPIIGDFTRGFFWSSDEMDVDNSKLIYFLNSQVNVSELSENKKIGVSIRCLKD
jgi:uncharacterized protein (TIGR02145 family)